MKIFLVILLTWCLCNMHVGAILGFGRTDCSCTCADGTICKKANPNFLEFKFRECQCEEGTCPSQSLYNGKVPCGSAWEVSNVFRCFFYPCDYSTNPVYSGNVTLLGSSLGLTNIAIWDFMSVQKHLYRKKF